LPLGFNAHRKGHKVIPLGNGQEDSFLLKVLILNNMALFKVTMLIETDDNSSYGREGHYCLAKSFEEARLKTMDYIACNTEIKNAIVYDQYGTSGINPNLYNKKHYKVVEIELINDVVIN
jgi:outer membrane cobalamin receptor